MLAPLVGRQEEVAWIRERLDGGEKSKSSIVLVAGEAGIGKTRLLKEVIDEKRNSAAIRFPHSRFASPGLGLRHLADGSGDAGVKLRAELLASGEEADAWRLLSIHRAADELVTARSGSAIIFDDLQWADELTLGWLSQAVNVLRSSSTVVLAGIRATESLPRKLDPLMPAIRSGDIETLYLRPLGVQAVTEFAESLGHVLTNATAQRLVSLSGGVPLAVSEILHELSRRGEDLEAALGTGETKLATLPLLASIVREQASELGPDALHAVAIASLLPTPVSAATIQSVSRLPPARFRRALEEAVGSGLVMNLASEMLSFRHELQREAFERQLPPEEKNALHKRIAGVMSADPNYPAGPIADHLAEAGELEEALEWLERAAKDSSREHDHGNALTYLIAAIETCSNEDTERLARLSEQVVVAARCCNQSHRGLDVVDSALERTGRSKHRGRLLVCRGKLVSYSGDFQERARILKEALQEFDEVGDDSRRALVLGELAFPVGAGMSLDERIELGEEGLRLTERLDDPDALALCAVNLASSKFYSGNEESFELWARAANVLRSSTSFASPPNPLQSRGELAMRTYNNWSLAALAYGDFDQAKNVLEEGLSCCTIPYWKSSFRCTESLYLWRTGRWDEALASASEVEGSICRPQALAIAAAVKTAILFERARQPDISPLVAASRSLIDWCDEEFGAVAQSLLIRIRLARREPAPDRDLMTLVDLVAGSGMRVGWEDLLPAAAEVSATTYRRVRGILQFEELPGLRGRAARALAEGWTAAEEGRDDDGETLLLEAVDRFEELPEPFPAARALERLGRLRSARGERSGDFFKRAAETYSALGAERSLANLVRTVPNPRALQRFNVPESQAHSRAPGLTPREREVANLARQGYSSRAIGEELGIATVTVKKHLEHIKIKLGYRSKSDLVRLFGS